MTSHQLRVCFFPFMAQGHMIPIADMAKMFATRGIKVTIITTPLNASIFSKAMERAKDLEGNVRIQTVKFPCTEAGLPEGCENIKAILSDEMRQNFFKATNMLQQPLEEILRDFKPDCLVSDTFLPWTTHVAAKLGIKRLAFHGTSFFSLCVSESLRLHEPHNKVSSVSEPFVIPNLPDKIQLTRMQLQECFRRESDITELDRKIQESELMSYGVIVNSYYELEPAYADHYMKVSGKKAWHIGPVSLCNRSTEDKAKRGPSGSLKDEQEYLNWLNTKEPGSVIYVSFGSMANFRGPQLREIAEGLEASGQYFIWVVKEDNIEEWLPEGFEKRMEGKGLIVRGWAPQMLILDHIAVGGFVTHCGWNSILEGICAGVPLVAWPLFAEQFYNEKLVTQFLKIGVDVHVGHVGDEDCVKREQIEQAVTMIMAVGEEAEKIRSRVGTLGEMARKAVQEGGSSYSDLNALPEDLKSQ